MPQDAVGAAASIDAEMSADGVDEYFGVMLPRMLQRGAVTLPDSAPAVHVVCDDAPGTWTVRAADGRPVLEDAAEPVARVRGSAEDLLLVLWGRRDVERLRVDGDRDAALVWLTLGGN